MLNKHRCIYCEKDLTPPPKPLQFSLGDQRITAVMPKLTVPSVMCDVCCEKLDTLEAE